MRQIKELFNEGIEFKKCGVLLTCIENKSLYILDLLADLDFIERNEKRQCALECVKGKFGDKNVAIGPCKMHGRAWAMSRQNMTQNYFSWKGMLTVGSDIL